MKKKVINPKEKKKEMSIQNPVCGHHTDCFALGKKEKDKCSILMDTDFGEKGCPFYKRDINEIGGRDYE